MLNEQERRTYELLIFTPLKNIAELQQFRIQHVVK